MKRGFLEQSADFRNKRGLWNKAPLREFFEQELGIAPETIAAVIRAVIRS